MKTTVNWIVFETEELVKECIANGLETDELKFSSSFESNLLQDQNLTCYTLIIRLLTQMIHIYITKITRIKF